MLYTIVRRELSPAHWQNSLEYRIRVCALFWVQYLYKGNILNRLNHQKPTQASFPGRCEENKGAIGLLQGFLTGAWKPILLGDHGTAEMPASMVGSCWSMSGVEAV